MKRFTLAILPLLAASGLAGTACAQAPAARSIVQREVCGAKQVIDSKEVDTLVKAGFCEKLYRASVKAEEQRRASLAFR